VRWFTAQVGNILFAQRVGDDTLFVGRRFRHSGTGLVDDVNRAEPKPDERVRGPRRRKSKPQGAPINRARFLGLAP